MKHWLLLLLTTLACAAEAANPAPLGRLFLTPADRAALDIVRQNNRPPERIVTPGNAGEDESAAAEPAPPPPVVTVHGYVKRSDGKGTVWVNGQPVPEKGNAKEFEVGRMQGNTNTVPITLPSTGQTVKLKAGQSYDPASGKVGSLREIAPPAEAALPLPADLKDKRQTYSTQNKPPIENSPSGKPPAAPSVE